MAGHGRHAQHRPAHAADCRAPRRLRATSLLPMAAAVVAGIPAAASAATPGDGGPTTTTAEVSAAVKASPVTSDVPDSAYSVTGVRTAAEGSWATAHLVPTVGSLQPADAVLHHTDAGWKLVGLGGAEIGCSVPAPVRGAFDLTCAANGNVTV